MSQKGKLAIDPTTNPAPYAAVILAFLLGETKLPLEWKILASANGKGAKDAKGPLVTLDAKPESSYLDTCLELATLAGYDQSNTDAQWLVDWVRSGSKQSGFAELQEAWSQLDNFLKLRTFLVGDSLSPLDALVWASLRSNAMFCKNLKDGKLSQVELARWYNFVAAQSIVVDGLKLIQEEANRLKERRKDQGSFEIELPGARKGAVVTRFPPEPSGYLHIGHAKAVLLNEYFARHYDGKLIIRFDDTNPSKEKDEYEASILEDLKMLGVSGDVFTHTSDYFDQLEEFAVKLIQNDKAYADNTPLETMRQERFDGIPSKCRDLKPEESLKIFQGMKEGAEFAQAYCIRAKIDMSATNKALRDPVIFRCNPTPHHKTGTRYKAYPTYDFACPIVDSIEGVTHALRTDEYHDRNDQYIWIAEAAGLRVTHIWDYSRLNFIHTLLSKRKLTWFVEKGLVAGWDDPRFPTVRGVLRRGMTVPALREYILMQGASKNALMLEWDKIWAVNKRHIDPIASRHVALVKENLVQVRLVGQSDSDDTLPYTKDVPKHKKNLGLGNKKTNYSNILFLEGVDVEGLKEGEEITLMDWGNAIIESIQREDNGQITGVTAKLNLSGDFKSTEKKLCWLSPDPERLVSVILYDYDYLITKKKLEENDNLEDYITPVTEFKTPALGDPNLRYLQKGDIIQLERKGFYICDKALGEDVNGNGIVHLIAIPDGKAKSTASKHQ